jgi:hypothetical protein
LRQCLEIGPESKTGMYLGCNVHKTTVKLESGIVAQGIVYDMESFLEQCIERYKALSRNSRPLKTVRTPFVAQDENRSVYRNPCADGPSCRWCGFVDGVAMQSHSDPGPITQYGELASVAASILMKCLYVARMARFDLLRPVQGLAKYLTKWTPAYVLHFLHQVPQDDGLGG